ncbi:hypothetical protein NDU88_002258 [Pleurodeles waltl]|uniref:Uncharacterized protein n=1 Tax=Pleurodeles waltl TaxID=8319 RepID=A0AAV7T2R7_PLEWA|nr:hypothetical protein NDU88_002258 [Pleurodeles waltl]
MAGPLIHKNESSIRDLLTKPMGKKLTITTKPPLWCLQLQVATPEGTAISAGPVTRVFLKTLFGALQADIATLNQDITVDIKGLTKEINELGDRVSGLEETIDAQRE